MITLGLFIQQFMIGLAISAIDGPVAILCMQKTLASGFKPGLLVGLGSAVAYSLYSVLGGLGSLKALTSFGGLAFLAGFGAIFLFWLGIMTFRFMPIWITKKYISDETSFYSFISAFFFTLANPASILLFIIFYTGFDMQNLIINSHMPFFTLFGLFLGLSSWWLVLSSFIGKIRNNLSGNVLVHINHFSGIFLIIFGCYAVFRFYRDVNIFL